MQVFTSLRLRAKKKMSLIRCGKFASFQFGRRESLVGNLSEMDNQILSMIGVDNLDGQQKLGEGGFPYKMV